MQYRQVTDDSRLEQNYQEGSRRPLVFLFNMKVNQFDHNRKKTGLWKINCQTDPIVDIIIYDLMPSFIDNKPIYSWEGNYHEDKEIDLWKFYGSKDTLVAENIYII